ncbi:MAG: hypothetical protein COY38_00555 [Candidatus Aenigmarchaeota archaeon CG_4_10_14_0_8_um_filter_37_24]|nr:MAG: hypothetical protein AUJ50_04235 [Candidatus Aenigmarchaeota archaeon CG1_02_38_14]PIW41237.1 MAG: hypothetical protein COW21_02925 [Candidatus Aenigmarchaeota archaeon CG15_BIG_FIL_POST_REV_8_21_14_020_37_27]PIX50520.1 MAG: hypothetical protein COZ52_03685 [Candidatus Aenigmarchaeota archaeon CG_4_8_14_3_um_filter_37_24]PIY35291.1 MAG: hypothetical protein COZ04_03965 [Candidatus Aenigmarchaeota archaeon CG_4_10_14_3_um_filter_37_21]PIZ36254.1 MAG: hypothetical protein COY38_00555 [Can
MASINYFALKSYKNVKKMKRKKCPACKSTNVFLDTGGITGKWRCNDCGYVGVLVITEDV